ncbi:hypothetical protein [Caldalkalibacillus salinus]|uniref:hypothetical protein n=1 Tax=Caldalkalibacillus salinus TaxID=2803787 RepID=UPI0019221D1F|nr:hypothetical protein [Caldalkalibacillus salinus]
MDIIFDLSWKVFNVLLILPVIFFLRLIFKKKTHFYFALTLFLIVTALFIVKANYTTFEDVYADSLNEDTMVESVTIFINDLTNHKPEREVRTRTTIEDTDVIARILDDLSGLELKNDPENYSFYKKYALVFTVTNEEKHHFYRTNKLHINIDEQHLNRYKIVNGTDHLKTIKQLVESDDIEWKQHGE